MKTTLSIPMKNEIEGLKIMPALSLTQNSQINFATHADVIKANGNAMNTSFSGITNLARAAPVSLKRLEKLLNKKVSCARYQNQVTVKNNQTAARINPDLNESSSDFFKKWENNYV